MDDRKPPTRPMEQTLSGSQCCSVREMTTLERWKSNRKHHLDQVVRLDRLITAVENNPNIEQLLEDALRA